MKLLLTVIIVCFVNISLFSQTFGFSFGYTTKHFVPIDFHLSNSKGLGFKLNFNIKAPNGCEGEKYTTLNWDIFPEDVRTKGSYFTTVDLGVGKYFERFFILGLIGGARETFYKNCYDDLGILGENNKFYKTLDGKMYFNFGAEVGYIKSNIMLSLHYTYYSGLGLKFGFIFPSKRY